MRVLKQLQGRTTKPKIWKVQVQSNRVTVTWGQEGGKMQSTVQSHKGVNIGKSNEKTPNQVAQEWADRQVLLKKREGYKEVDPKTGELLEEESATTIDNFIHLPPNLRFYKPQNSMNKHLEKLAAAGKAWYLRKRDGEMLISVLGEDEIWRFYSSKMLPSHKDEYGFPWSDRFPWIVNALASIGDVPTRTIILGELVAGPEEDHLQRVGEVTKSLTDRALDIQRNLPLWYCPWDMAFHGGKDLLTTCTYAERYDLLERYFDENSRPEYITLPEILSSEDYTLEEAQEFAKESGWEGFVVVDPYHVGYGDKAMSWGGKPDRPKFCAKLKPMFEGDFIARWDPDNGIGEWGKGKKSGGVGSLALYLWDPDKQEEVYISKCGGGLTDELVHKLNDPGLYPMAVQVEFASWTHKGSLQFPEFVRIREDKTIEECTLDQRPVG